jgi:hypothetical protein
MSETVLPSDLRAVGYDVRGDGEGERILPNAILQKLVAGLGGELVPWTEGSTRPVTTIVAHPGTAKVLRYTVVLRDIAPPALFHPRSDLRD